MRSRWGRVVTALGLDDGKGHLSFNKSVTLVALVTWVYAVVRLLTPTWELLSFGAVVIGAGFGLKGYLGAIKARHVPPPPAEEESDAL